MPININGNPQGMTIQGTPIGQVIVRETDGTETVVYSTTSAIVVDDFERSSLGDSYWISDTGQTTLPDTSTAAAYAGQYGFEHPDGNPNATVSLASTNPAYSSTNQPSTLENYPATNEVTELFFKPVVFGTGALARIGFNMEGYGTSPGLRLHMDQSGYWRIEEYNSGWDYYGTDPQEDSTFTWDVGSWHRIVIDQTAWPDVSAHLWNAETGTHKSDLSTTGGSGNHPNSGIMFWANTDAHIQIDEIEQIDASEYTAGTDM